MGLETVLMGLGAALTLGTTAAGMLGGGGGGGGGQEAAAAQAERDKIAQERAAIEAENQQSKKIQRGALLGQITDQTTLGEPTLGREKLLGN